MKTETETTASGPEGPTPRREGRLTAARVEQIFHACLFKEGEPCAQKGLQGEPTDDHVEAEGVMIPKETVKIRLGGFEGWLLDDDDGLGRPLAFYDQCNESGDIIKLEVSYAHFFPGQDVVMRHGKKIGTSADIEVL